MSARPPGPYESVTFLELHNHDPQGAAVLPALWVRYTWSDAGTPDGRREVRVWAIATEPTGPLGATRRRPLTELRDGRPAHYESTVGALGPDAATGDVGAVRWDLALVPNGPPHDHVPAAVAGLGRTYRSMVTDLHARGTVWLHGEAVPFDGRGVQGHVAGARNRLGAWCWVHAPGIGEHDDVVFEGLCARLGPGFLRTPPLTSLRLAIGDVVHAWSSPLDLVRTRSRLEPHAWRFEAHTPDLRLTGVAELGAPGTTALVEYRDERDRPLWCRNNPLGRLHLIVERVGRPTLTLVGDATVELGGRTRGPGRRAAPSRW